MVPSIPSIRGRGFRGIRGGSGVVIPILYVDSVTGNNAYDGLTEVSAKQTLAAVQAVVVAGGRISMAKGSRWREQFTVPVNSLKMQVHGTGAAPIIDGRVIVAGTWVRHDAGTYPDVWSQSLTPAGAVGSSSERTSLYADEVRLAYAASIAAVQSSGGWFSSNRNGGVQTVYMKSTANPSGTGVVYEFTSLNNATAGHYATIGAVRSATITGPIEMIGHRGHYGSLSGGPGRQSLILIEDGSIHHTVTEASLVEDLVCMGFDPAQTAQSPYTAYIGDGTGRTHTARRILILGDSAILGADRPSGLFTHGSTVGFDQVTFDQCITRYCLAAYSTGDIHPGALTVSNSVTMEARRGISSGAATTTIERVMCRLEDYGGAGGYTDTGPGTASKTRVIRNCVFAQADTSCTHQAGIEIEAKGGSILIENCILYFPDAVDMRVLRFNGAGAGLAVTMRNCIICGRTAGGRHLAVIGATTYVGENNIFVEPANYWEVDNGSGGYTIKYSLAEWRTATGQDLTSTTGDPGWLGDPDAGDFRLNPAGLAASMGCGPDEFWNFNTRAIEAGAPSAWPTLPATVAEARTYIANPIAWDFYPAPPAASTYLRSDGTSSVFRSDGASSFNRP